MSWRPFSATCALIDLAADQLGGAGDAAAIAAAIGQVHTLLAQAVEQRLAPIDLQKPRRLGWRA